MEGATEKIWMDGEFLPWDEAKIHVLTHSLHYGLGVFEGIRCYKTNRGPAVFRLDEHMKRLCDSAHIVGLDIPFDQKVLTKAVLETIRANKVDACYIRPLVWLGYGSMGVNPAGAPVRTMIAVWKWGAYLGEEGLSKGIRVKVSSFTSHHPNSYMTGAKTTGNYAVSQLAKMEAVQSGFDEALMLDPEGFVTQGSGENIFLVRDGVLKTPPLQGILRGITRETVIYLAREQGLEIEVEAFARDEVYVADEAFFTGTAAELTPIREVDNRMIGDGKPGPITKRLQDAFFAVVNGRDEGHLGWLTTV
ncbi:MAG TPA: branched chain amino acid aminotransferase [Nitrospinae bacterium]|nr:branched chain amino acid aminotransferase [Nitrospinota bacterium]